MKIKYGHVAVLTTSCYMQPNFEHRQLCIKPDCFQGIDCFRVVSVVLQLQLQHSE